MDNSFKQYAVDQLGRVLQEDAFAKRAELSIEFLQSLLRQSLADFVAAQYPLLEYKQVRTYVHSGISVRQPTLTVDTMVIADHAIQASTENRPEIQKKLSGQLMGHAERILSKFFHFLEHHKKNPANTLGTLFSDYAKSPAGTKLDTGVLRAYLLPDGGMTRLDEVQTKNLRVQLEGKSWQVKLVGYPAAPENSFSKKDALLASLKQKMELLRNTIGLRLATMAKTIQAAGNKDPLSIGVKPFLKGALDKMRFVEDFAQKAFSRLNDTALPPASAENLLQTLDQEINGLERYMHKLTKIFEKLRREGTQAVLLPEVSGMEISAEDKLLLEEYLSAQQDKGFQAVDISGMNEKEPTRIWHKQRNFDREIDWAIKATADQKQEEVNGAEPELLSQTKATIIETGISVDAGPIQTKQRFFAKLMKTLLDPGRSLGEKDRAAKAVTNTTRRRKTRPARVDVVLPAFSTPEHGTLQRTDRTRKFYYHFFS